MKQGNFEKAADYYSPQFFEQMSRAQWLSTLSTRPRKRGVEMVASSGGGGRVVAVYLRGTAVRGRRPALTIELSDAERGTLEGWLRATSTPLGKARRARAVLLLADSATYVRAAELTGLGERHVRKWARRFAERRLAGLADLPRPGRPPVFPPRGGRARGEGGLRAAG